MYLYNKNILEYAQIARSGPKYMILDIEGHSNKYSPICHKDTIDDWQFFMLGCKVYNKYLFVLNIIRNFFILHWVAKKVNKYHALEIVYNMSYLVDDYMALLM